MNNDKNGIVVEDVSYSANGTVILNDIGFDVTGGELVGIIGPNGAGKSTLARLLVNIIKPVKGTISIQGNDITRLKTKDLYRMISFIPQNLDFSFPFSVRDTVLMGRMPYLGRLDFEKEDDYRLADDALRSVGMKEFAARDVTSLSGGEKQLVAIARALVQQTRYMVLDEPISNLDIYHQIKIMSYLKDMSSDGKGVITVLHDLGFASAYCDKVIVMDKGVIVDFGPPEKVINESMISRVFRVNVNLHKSEKTGFVTVDPVSPVE